MLTYLGMLGEIDGEFMVEQMNKIVPDFFKSGFNKEPFQTVETGKVGMYLCGPTVYREAHIGHMVGPVIFDCVKRYLTYCGFDVTWVVNITDIDDKLINEANNRGIPMSQVAEEMTKDYVDNLAAFGVDQIDEMPLATEHIPDIVDFIGRLIQRGYDY